MDERETRVKDGQIETWNSGHAAIIAKRFELSKKMNTRAMKFYAMLLGDGLFDTLRYARPHLSEVVSGIFIYSESDRMAVYQWKEGAVPVEIFSAKEKWMGIDSVRIRCKCGGSIYEEWNHEGTVTTDHGRDVNFLKERFCGKCAQGTTPENRFKGVHSDIQVERVLKPGSPSVPPAKEEMDGGFDSMNRLRKTNVKFP